MKPTAARRIIFFFLLTVLYQATTAQTIYNVTTSQNWSAIVASTDCNNCIFNLSPGVTVTFSGGGQCTTCTFNGGTMSFQSGSSGFGWYSGNAFNNETLVYNSTMTMQGGSFYKDSISLQVNEGFSTNTTYWIDSHIEILAGVTLTTTSTLDASGSYIAMAGTTASPSEYVLNGGTGLILNSSQMYLNGTSYINATSAITLDSTSDLYVGDGTSGSTAYLYYNTGGLAIYDASMIKIQNDNNYIYDWSGYTYYTSTSASSGTSYSTSSAYTSSINCGGSYAHSCAAPYVYGCATLNSGGTVQCTPLALANIALTAVPAGANIVNLSWSDIFAITADHYLVQRSTGNKAWATLASIAAGGYTAGDYQFEDPAAPAGTDNYRIARVDQDGAVLYSAISSVNIIGTAGTIGIGIHPNPVAGHTFFVTAPNTEQLTVNIFTVTGQLLSCQSLQGQVQYQLLLPSQLLPGNAVIVQVITTTGKQAFPLLLQ